MASEILNLSALCRCCHIDGTFKHLDKTYNFNGQIENYSTMLIECFGLLLSQPAIEASHTICDICIEKLRNALKFKKQVEQCEKKFENYCKNEILLQSKMKIESSSDYEVTIKPEIQIKLEDTYGQSPIHEYPELDNSKVSDDEENLNYVDGTENTDVKQCYLETDIPPSIPPHLNLIEPKLMEGNNEHKINYLQADTPKSNLNVTNKDVKQVAKKEKSNSQQKITKTRGNNKLKKEKLNESGPENKKSGQNERNYTKNITDVKGNPYTCVSCKGTYKTLRQLKRHIQKQHPSNTPKREYSCSICKGTYNTERALTLHISKEHSRMTCTICDRDFDSKELWYNHHRIEHDIYLGCQERVGQFVCSECGVTVKRRSTLRTHMLKHTNPRPKQVYTCDVCKKNYADRTSISKHIQWLHSATAPIKKFMCDICGYTVKDRTHLRIHIDTVHKKLKPFKCNLCPKAYGLNKQLKVHLRLHTGERPYECPFCDQKYTCSMNLKQHVKHFHNPNLGLTSIPKTESDQKFDFSFKYQCKVCWKGFDRRREIAAHNWTHTGHKPYKCDECGKDFISEYCYKRHLKLHMSEAPERVPCEICHKTFSSKAPMQRHMRTIHDPEKVVQQRGPRVKCEVCKVLVWDMEKHIYKKHSGNCHQCKFCPRSYTERGTLNRHIKERHSDVDNSCKLCGKKYIKLSSLKNHMVKKHDSM